MILVLMRMLIPPVFLTLALILLATPWWVFRTEDE